MYQTINSSNYFGGLKSWENATGESTCIKTAGQTDMLIVDKLELEIFIKTRCKVLTPALLLCSLCQQSVIRMKNKMSNIGAYYVCLVSRVPVLTSKAFAIILPCLVIMIGGTMITIYRPPLLPAETLLVLN